MLDVGSGLGYLPEAAREAGWEVAAFEPNEQAKNQILKKGIPLEESLDNLNRDSYDVITLYHVLEHIHDLRSTLKRLRKALREGGYLIVAVPNHDAYERSMYQEYWAAYDVPRHLYHFNRESIHYLCEKFKFEIITEELMPFDSFYVSLLSETYKNPEASTLNHYIKGFFMGLKSYWAARKNIRSASSIQYTLKKI
ncbi:SAM-dependent methyltransferase [Nitritalea halalkaliphila LW7]|uniref:SAM-dependent methyltransferase n=1 Tax=Nitritalea halalkaliphila LW7 TaxID=1189621 RepID=I5C5H1_9BACT|nr:SAM-dependent methyltransferase [Nitritalea halalkaliphila LW7]